ncbi:hypothetical protein CLOSTASPAR_04395 [[Clostridium] asparagiforme DSM 15981]|uniref:Uncharacterized protein n=1 Tax=[Clostridium] asparagiforme DSM 15981 TaxID=518636 RepID=C0D548_9FIRM|nr:hypothetical protein CLOSTASPAR_04395 [[Clostridium] asparagiforme DSM 15981]
MIFLPPDGPVCASVSCGSLKERYAVRSGEIPPIDALRHYTSEQNRCKGRLE